MKLLTDHKRIQEKLSKLGVDADKVLLFAQRHEASVAMETTPSVVLIITAEDWQLRAYPNGKPRGGWYKWNVFGSGPKEELVGIL